MQKNRILNGIGLAGLIGLYGCFVCTLLNDMFDLSMLMDVVHIGWGLSGVTVVFSLVESLVRLVRRKRAFSQHQRGGQG